ncbi:MAG: DUF664 domain-containing protein [Acidimicrobiales bacterium]
MELSATTATAYARFAFERMLAVADRLGDERVNERPIAPQVNSVASLVIHCCGVAEFWLGHVGAGRPTTRDRAAEFTATATVVELHDRVDACLAQLAADVEVVAGGVHPANARTLDQLEVAPGDDASLVLHVIEELFQHLGHCEITADALLPLR